MVLSMFVFSFMVVLARGVVEVRRFCSAVARSCVSSMMGPDSSGSLRIFLLIHISSYSDDRLAEKKKVEGDLFWQFSIAAEGDLLANLKSENHVHILLVMHVSNYSDDG